jgi:hypothetical protein
MDNSLLAVRGINHKYIVVGGTDSHRNIAFMDKIIGTAVMTDNVETARKLLKKYTLDSLQIKKLNRLRNNYGYHAI